MSPEEWRAVIDVHLNGAFYVSRAAAPHFKEQQSGSYIHMVSTSGLVGNFGQANYAAAKLGLSALSKSIAMDMAKFKVRSNCISPFAWSRMISSIPTETDEQRDRVARLQKMETAKIAPLAVFLASDAAADVTGQIFAGACQRNFPDEPEPSAALLAHRARLDAAIGGQPCDPGAAVEFLQARPVARRVRLGPGVTPSRPLQHRGWTQGEPPHQEAA